MRPDDDSFTGLDHAQRGRTPRGGAIYHLRVRTASRSKGHSARAACAYIERSAEYGREADASAELVYTESGHMPDWAEAEASGTAYWDAADLYERSNGRLYKSMDFALPLALDADQQQDLAVSFAHSLTDAEQLPYTLAIHAGNGANPHCHLMISERTNDDLERSPAQWFKRYNAAEPEAGGARKSTALHPKDWLLETRAAWAEQTNEALKEAGLELQIDHRSLEAQGIARVPGIHLGPHVLEMEARGIQTERGQLALGISQRNEQIQELQAQLREQLREEGLDYGRDRQSEASPRVAALSPRYPTPEAEPAPRLPGRVQGVVGLTAELRGPDEGLAAGHRRGNDQGLEGSPEAERGASKDRGGGVAPRARGMGRADVGGARAGASNSQEPRGAEYPPGEVDRAPREATRGVDLGHEPGEVKGAGGGAGVVPVRGHLRGDNLPPGRPNEPDRRGAEESRDESLDLSPAVGRDDGGRAEGNPEAARGQDGRAVATPADLVAARGQLAAARTRFERAAEIIAVARTRLERQAERQQQAELERELKQEQARGRRRGKSKGKGAEAEEGAELEP